MNAQASRSDTENVSFGTLGVSEVEHQKDRILELKKAKEERQYTIQRLLDDILLNGDSISEATLKRVFRPGSEDDIRGFSEHSLVAIEKVLLEPDKMPVPPDATYAGEIVLLKAELRVQAERVENLREHNHFLQDRVDFLTAQIEIKDRRMDEREAVLKKVMAERDALRKRVEETTGKGQ